MIRAIIIDDEAGNIENLKILLGKYCPGVVVCASATNVDQGIQLIREMDPAIIFLDIQMPDKTGFDLLQTVQNPGFEVIFVTAFDQYAIQAIRFSAIDYLLKPINTTELIKAVDRAIARFDKKRDNARLENLIRLLDNKAHGKIAIPGNRETIFLEPATIVYCQSDNNYTHLFDTSSEKYISSKPIFEYEELLDTYGFTRCHQSYLVNTRFIRSWIRVDGDRLLLEGGIEVPVSRNKKEKIKKLMGM